MVLFIRWYYNNKKLKIKKKFTIGVSDNTHFYGFDAINLQFGVVPMLLT